MWKIVAWKPGLLRLDLGKLRLFGTAQREVTPSRIRRLVIAADADGRTRSEIVEMVAKEMYEDGLANGGRWLDLGVWGPSLYSRDARRFVAELLGTGDGEGVPSTRTEAV